MCIKTCNEERKRNIVEYEATVYDTVFFCIWFAMIIRLIHKRRN